MNRPPKLLDQFDGKPIPPFWVPNTFLKGRKLTVILTRPRKRHKEGGHELFPEWTHDVWCGHYKGYGRSALGYPLFRTMTNAVEFAAAAWRSGYRIKKTGNRAKPDSPSLPP